MTGGLHPVTTLSWVAAFEGVGDWTVQGRPVTTKADDAKTKPLHSPAEAHET